MLIGLFVGLLLTTFLFNSATLKGLGMLLVILVAIGLGWKITLVGIILVMAREIVPRIILKKSH